jgi:hypothetical protein
LGISVTPHNLRTVNFWLAAPSIVHGKGLPFASSRMQTGTDQILASDFDVAP